mmetsp:Transcript_91896/g.259580  ORF Transcript_91896/g.259580 Transcript_91896/m.259580 type:complete len:153 (-) Transcript_91896:544-1002(-)
MLARTGLQALSLLVPAPQWTTHRRDNHHAGYAEAECRSCCSGSVAIAAKVAAFAIARNAEAKTVAIAHEAAAHEAAALEAATVAITSYTELLDKPVVAIACGLFGIETVAFAATLDAAEVTVARGTPSLVAGAVAIGCRADTVEAERAVPHR